MQVQWIYTGIILSLFLLLILGIPLLPNFMGIEVLEPMNLGMLIFLSLDIAAPLLAFRFLRMMKKDKV